MIYANTKEIDVTPVLGTVINGEFTCRYATHIADPLYAKALYVRNDSLSQLYIVVDICVMKRDFLDPIKVEIEKLTGIPVGHIMISSTHTHYGGSVADLLLAHADLAYRALLRTKLIQLAKEVVAKSIPAKIGFSRFEKPEHLTCRRYVMDPSYEPQNPVSNTVDAVRTNPFGKEDLILNPTTDLDAEVCYLGIQSLEGEWLGILANYNLHYVGDCPRSTITADYFGYFANKLRANLNSSDAVVVMTNGTSGEVNIWDFVNGDRYPTEEHAKSKMIGEDIADNLFADIGNLEWNTSSELAVLNENITLDIRPIDESHLKAAFEILSVTDYEALTYMDEELFKKVYAREQVLLTAYHSTYQFPIQCFKLGDITIGALGGEFFTETGKKLKSEVSKYFTVCLANDYVGYVPPKHEIENGGYETWRARSSFMAADSEEKVCEQTIKMIKRLV